VIIGYHNEKTFLREFQKVSKVVKMLWRCMCLQLNIQTFSNSSLTQKFHSYDFNTIFTTLQDGFCIQGIFKTLFFFFSS